MVLSPVVTGATAVENPTFTVDGFRIQTYGCLSDGPIVPSPGAIQTPGVLVEATHTEPDKNTYLILPGLTGADPQYNYGSHFLFQGHENGRHDANNVPRGYITRVNVDADAAHRVTVLAATDEDGNYLPAFDGSTWYPFSDVLLFTAELTPTSGGVWQATPGFPSIVKDMSGIFGRGGYEGIQSDDEGIFGSPRTCRGRKAP